MRADWRLVAPLLVTLWPGLLFARAATLPATAGTAGTSSASRDGGVRYEPGRGLRLGGTGLVIGGFAAAEGERLEDGETRGALEGANLFVLFDRLPFVRLFTEIEVGGFVQWERGEGVRSEPGVEVERLYGDVGASDTLNVRIGKFLTPIGRWNLAHAEPLVWTASEPLIVEEVFDETVSGAMLWGSRFPRGGALSYSLHGTFLDPIAPDRDAPPAEHGAGAHLEWASLGGWNVGASYLASESRDGGWNHLGGADFLWQPAERIELSGEAVFGEGTRAEGGVWGVYVQGVVETVPTLHAVARYERFEPSASGRAIDLFDLGLAWAPTHFLRLKADYRFADRFDELARDLAAAGLHGSLSVLF